MRRILPLIVFVWALPVFGQTQMMCRDLKESGGFLYQGETIINGQACRQVSYAPQPSALATASAPVADPKPAPVASAPNSAVPTEATSAPLPVPAPTPKVMAQQDTLQEVSSQYPIKAHVIAIEMHSGTTTTGSGGYHYNKTLCPLCTDLPDTRSTESYTWHLMKTVIGDKMYGLSAPGGRHNTWLDIGYYAFKRVKNGFEVQYRDEKGKVRQEVLTIRSEEVAPAQS